ncbi:MAG: hypothetical protein OEY51_06455, partial [Cyclobacteriaceae bacterium]|nr:hypothetical protein [Cyclobacteriaceae bacterium]
YDARSVTLTLHNDGGNQSIPLSYLNATGSGDFTVKFPYSLPYTLKPGEKVSFTVDYHPTTPSPSRGILFIKKSDHGQLKPLEVVLSGGE